VLVGGGGGVWGGRFGGHAVWMGWGGGGFGVGSEDDGGWFVGAGGGVFAIHQQQKKTNTKNRVFCSFVEQIFFEGFSFLFSLFGLGGVGGSPSLLFFI